MFNFKNPLVMKKLVLLLLASTGFMFPLFSQIDHVIDDNEAVPIESLTLKKDQVPKPIIDAVKSDFKSDQAFTYGKFPYVLKKYAWVVDPDQANKKPDFYEVYIKSNDGSDIWAIYNPDGKIVESKTIRKDANLPMNVDQALAKSQYKDWKVVGDKELIKYFDTKNNVEEHVKVTVEKSGQKKNITFNLTEPMSKQG
jgi:hypothetical protein